MSGFSQMPPALCVIRTHICIKFEGNRRNIYKENYLRLSLQVSVDLSLLRNTVIKKRRRVKIIASKRLRMNNYNVHERLYKGHLLDCCHDYLSLFFYVGYPPPASDKSPFLFIPELKTDIPMRVRSNFLYSKDISTVFIHEFQ